MVRMSLNIRKVFLTTFIVVGFVYNMQYKYRIYSFLRIVVFSINKTGGLNHCKDREENRTWCNVIFKPESPLKIVLVVGCCV